MSDEQDITVSAETFEAWRKSPEGIALRDSLRETAAMLTDAPRTMAVDGWEGRVEGFVPVQGYGTVDGHTWYFRARHGSMQLRVYTGPFQNDEGHERLPLAETEIWNAHREYDGRSDCSGWMYFSEAWETIASFIAEWRESRKVQQ